MEESRVFASGAKRDSEAGKNRVDLIPVECLWRLGWHYTKGAEHYGEHNWEKGIPDDSFVASLERHVMKYRMGYTDEDHLSAAVFNIFGLMFNEIVRQKAKQEEAKPVEPAKEKAKETPARPKAKGKKKELDMGKIKALKAAGWPLKEIADEMGVSAQTILNRLKED